MVEHDASVKTSNWPARFGAGLGRAFGVLIDQLYPPACVHCQAPLAAHGQLCAKCWRQLQFITEPKCPVLGLPFAVDMGPGALSAEAIADPPAFDRARSAVIYNHIAQSLVTGFKYRDRTELAGFMAHLMASAAPELFEDEALLLPVPLHHRRQWKRRYNQSALLAQHLGKITNMDCETGLIFRRRATRQQVGLTSAQRATNVKGAFAASPDFIGEMAGRRAILVDDVITTGATMRSIARFLKKSGAEKIDVISFARVVFHGQTAI